MFRSLFFSDPFKLLLVNKQLAAEPSFGWWTTRLHLARYSAPSVTLPTLLATLPEVLANTPNLSVFLVEWQLGPAFGPIADALAEHCADSLRTVQWHVPPHATSKVIWALASLPHLSAVHVAFDSGFPVASDDASPLLGAASNLALALPALQHLALRGVVEPFLAQVTGWTLPALQIFSLDSTDWQPPDVVAFVAAHGARLAVLDLRCASSLRYPDILAHCPMLRTFAFNADDRVPYSDTGAGDDDDDDDPDDARASALVHRPHEHITHIGCHGLLYAFAVGGHDAALQPMHAAIVRSRNDRNFAALTRANFPALRCVRLLSAAMLRDLEREGGPMGPDGTEGEGWKRWVKWSDASEQEGLRLEDCTGALLGTLPGVADSGSEEDESGSEYESGEEEEYEEEESYEHDKEFGFAIPIPPRERPENTELRQLLKECRKMTAEREEPMLFIPPAFSGPA